MREVNAMQKQSAVLIICLGLVIVFAYRLQAFEYDVWKSGIAIGEALKIAEMHDIPLTYAELNRPLQRGRDHYRPFPWCLYRRNYHREERERGPAGSLGFICGLPAWCGYETYGMRSNIVLLYPLPLLLTFA